MMENRVFDPDFNFQFDKPAMETGDMLDDEGPMGARRHNNSKFLMGGHENILEGNDSPE